MFSSVLFPASSACCCLREPSVRVHQQQKRCLLPWLFLSRRLSNKTTWRPGGVRPLASTRHLLIDSKTKPRSQLSSVSSELASEVQCSQNWFVFTVLKALQEGFLQTGFKVYFVNVIRNYNNIACLPTMQSIKLLHSTNDILNNISFKKNKWKSISFHSI